MEIKSKNAPVHSLLLMLWRSLNEKEKERERVKDEVEEEEEEGSMAA